MQVLPRRFIAAQGESREVHGSRPGLWLFRFPRPEGERRLSSQKTNTGCVTIPTARSTSMLLSPNDGGLPGSSQARMQAQAKAMGRHEASLQWDDPAKLHDRRLCIGRLPARVGGSGPPTWPSTSQTAISVPALRADGSASPRGSHRASCPAIGRSARVDFQTGRSRSVVVFRPRLREWFDIVRFIRCTACWPPGRVRGGRRARFLFAPTAMYYRLVRSVSKRLGRTSSCEILEMSARIAIAVACRLARVDRGVRGRSRYGHPSSLTTPADGV